MRLNAVAIAALCVLLLAVEAVGQTATPTVTPTPTLTVVPTERRFPVKAGPGVIPLLPPASAVAPGDWFPVSTYSVITVQYEVSNPCTSYTVTIQGYIGGEDAVILLSKQQSDVGAGAAAVFAITPPVGFIRANVAAIDSCTVAVYGLGVP